MAKFSGAIEEDGEGPSNLVPKRPRLTQDDAESTEQEDEEEESEGEEASEEGEEAATDPSAGESEEELEEESGAEQEAMNPPRATTDNSISITLTDPDVLDCSICYEALTIPVFQCDNGHVACSTCCRKIGNKCPSCATSIGYNRCRALEKVLESVKVSCQYTKYGCGEAFSYSQKQNHEKTCFYLPCSCPLAGCNFEGSIKQLYEHFGKEHKYAAVRFSYNEQIPITIPVDDKYLILRENRDGSLFILHNKVETLGNVVTLSRIGRSTEGCFYELVARSQVDGSAVRLTSVAKSTPKRVESPPSLAVLLVPSQFLGNSRLLKLILSLRPYPNYLCIQALR